MTNRIKIELWTLGTPELPTTLAEFPNSLQTNQVLRVECGKQWLEITWDFGAEEGAFMCRQGKWAKKNMVPAGTYDD